MNTAAFVLAAGRGERMRPLTDTTPKPLLTVKGVSLLEGLLSRLGQSGVPTAWVNTAWLGDQIAACLAKRHADWPDVALSQEGQEFGHALETAGGIARRLGELPDVFWVCAADIWAPGFMFKANAVEKFRKGSTLAHIWLVPNPAHHPKGDFWLGPDGLAQPQESMRHPSAECLTYSTIGLFKRALFQTPWLDIDTGNPQGVRAPLGPLLKLAAHQGLVSAERYEGEWVDVGTPARLADLNKDMQ